MRSHTRSRYYIQCARDEKLEDWPDDRLWDELKLRLGPDVAPHARPEPALEKSITALHSFVSLPMRHGRLFLAGDGRPTSCLRPARRASTWRPPTFTICRGRWSRTTPATTARLLRRLQRPGLGTCVKAERFSWWLTLLMHKVHPEGSFAEQMQRAEIDYLVSSPAGQPCCGELRRPAVLRSRRV